MLKQIEGSLGVAEAVALCRPGVVCGLSQPRCSSGRRSG